MPRKSIGLLVLAGITLSGAVGGQMMRSGTRSPRRDAPAPALPPTQPLTAALLLPPFDPDPVPHSQERTTVTHDVFALAGD